jgi:signal transduction histidine kinase
MNDNSICPPSDEEDAKWIGLRESLRRSQSLAAAGQFAATIVHEINNPLEAISNLNYLLQEDADDAVSVRQYGKQIDEQLAVLIRVARQTLSFCRPAAERPQVAVATLADAALRIHRKAIAAKRIRLDIRLPGNVSLDVDPGEMLQVMSNLISNAVDALPVEGALYLRAIAPAAESTCLSQTPGPAFPLP